MFDFVRKHTRILLFILVLLILPSFVMLGISGYDGYSNSDTDVAKVGRQKITQGEWDAAHSAMVTRAKQQQPDLNPALFDTPEFKQRSLDLLLRDYTVAAAARDQRLRAPDSRLQRLFTTLPDFASLRNPDGSVNIKLLEAQGVSSAQFAERLRNEVSLSQVLGGVEATGTTSKLASRRAVEALFQVRDVQWMKFEPKNYVAQLSPTPEQLRKFFDEPAMADIFRTPERADVEYVVLDIDAIKLGVKVDEAALHKTYQDSLQTFMLPEERRASHILVKAEKSAPAAQRAAAHAKAEQLLADVRKTPARFAELAKMNSDDPLSAPNGGDLEFSPKGGLDETLDKAVFSLKKGEVSGVVESGAGYHIVMVTDVRGGQTQPFEAVRAKLEEDARKQQATRLYAEAQQKFTDTVYEQPDRLKPVADDLKLTVQTASEVLHTPGAKDQGVLGHKRLLDVLFDPAHRAKRHNTEAIEVSPGKLVSARVVKHYPASKPPFAQVEAQVRERWVARESLKAARTDAEQKMALWQKSTAQAQLPPPVQMSRRLAYSQPPTVLEAALRAPEAKLPVWQVVDIGSEGVALIKVNKVLPLQIVPEEERATEAQFSTYWGRAESDAYLRALKREYKAKSTANAASKPVDTVK